MATMAFRFFIFLLLGRSAAELQAHFVGPDTGYPLARCLDGTPALYYLSPGYDSGKDKYFIFHQGGGFCDSDADCLERAGTYLGSTSSDDPANNMYAKYAQENGMWRDVAQNPLMHNWNHIYVRYCDGAYYSGDRLEPRTIDGKEVFFRGRYITEAIFTDLAPKLATATDVVLSGCSAGAIRIYAHLDSLRAMVPSAAKVVGLADSGFFMDVELFTPKKKFVVSGHNGTALLNTKCLANYRGEPHKCYVGSVVSAYLDTPLFAFQSRFDTDQREGEMDEACRNSEACVSNYAASLTTKMEENLAGQHGYFLDSCERHCFFSYERPIGDASGLTPLQAFASWYDGGAAVYGQAPVPSCKQCCYGRSPTNRLLSADVLI